VGFPRGIWPWECQGMSGGRGSTPHFQGHIYGMYMGVGMALGRRFERFDAELLLFIITGVASVSKTVMSVCGHAGRGLNALALCQR